MRRQFFDIVQIKLMRRKNLPRRVKRKIGKMLMIDRIELMLLDQPQDMGKFQRHRAMRFQRDPQSFDKIVDIRHMRQHVIPHNQIGWRKRSG